MKHIKEAMELEMKNQFEEAAEKYEDALKLVPEHGEALLQLGLVLDHRQYRAIS